MSGGLFNVLFLCTGNSARSILAESLLNHEGGGRFRGFSAGSHPTGRVNPHALEVLRRHGLTGGDLRSKSWDEFAAPGAPLMYGVITVCDAAAGEVCPLWPGAPGLAHWGLADPAAETGGEAQIIARFEETLAILQSRIRQLVENPENVLAPGGSRAR